MEKVWGCAATVRDQRTVATMHATSTSILSLQSRAVSGKLTSTHRMLDSLLGKHDGLQS